MIDLWNTERIFEIRLVISKIIVFKQTQKTDVIIYEYRCDIDKNRNESTDKESAPT